MHWGDAMTGLKSFVKENLSPFQVEILRLVYKREDLPAVLKFLFSDFPRVSFGQKLDLVKRLYEINAGVLSPHTQEEILSFISTILALPPEAKGVIVEAGCFRGSSTAKFSLAAALTGRQLVVFDSFEGIPENDEPMDKDIYGRATGFKKGDYCGALEEVARNVSSFGRIQSCRFIKGWFDDTMPDFHEPIAAAYIDVDLASSTKTCLQYLYPLLEEGGTIYSQDGHLPLVLDVLDDDAFWMNDVGFKKPTIHGFGEKKLVSMVKGM
jgi:O-methyltransferase